MAHRASRVVRVVVIIALAVATSLLGYLLVNNFQFTRGRTVYVRFPSVGDLNAGAWVRKSGIKVGSVTRLAPAEDEKTIIVTVVMRPGQTVRVDDHFALVAKGILGDMYIEQKPGPRESANAEEGRVYDGEPSFSITDLLGGDGMGAITDLAGGLSKVLAVLEANAAGLDSSIKDIAATARNVRIVTERAVVLTESVPRITAQITGSVDTLQATVEDMAGTVRTVLGRLEGTLDAGSTDLAASLAALRKGSEDVQAAVTELTAQNSVIGKLSAPATADSLSTTVQNLEEISRALLVVSQDAQKIVKDVGTILQAP